MKTPYTTLIINHADGSKQIVKPNPRYFQGDWQSLAYAIAKIDRTDVTLRYDLK